MEILRFLSGVIWCRFFYFSGSAGAAFGSVNCGLNLNSSLFQNSLDASRSLAAKLANIFWHGGWGLIDSVIAIFAILLNLTKRTNVHIIQIQKPVFWIVTGWWRDLQLVGIGTWLEIVQQWVIFYYLKFHLSIYNKKPPIRRFFFGWGSRIRTYEWRHQKPLPYHLAIPQYQSFYSIASVL